MGRSDEMDGRRCSSDRQIIYPFEQSEFLPTIKWAAEMPPFFIGKTAGTNWGWNVKKCIQMDKIVDFDKKILIFCVLCFEMQWKFMDISFKMVNR